MSYLDFDYEKNSIFIGMGNAFNRSKIKVKDQNKSFKEYDFEGDFAGIEIPNFLSHHEKDGVAGELKFKELLERNNIPYLYVGQGPFGIERSGVLIDKTKSKRPDFLINISDMGTIMFDAKCRRKIGFHNTEETYFSLFVSEFEALKNLQDSILMPVWLAFINRDEIHKTDNPKFYFISVSTIEKYWAGLFDFFNDEEDLQENLVIRIPNTLFTEIEDKIIFEVGYLKIEEALLNEYAKKYIGFNRVVKDEIKNTIRNCQCFKTTVFNVLQTRNVQYCYKSEIDHHVNLMIKKKIIDFQPRTYLSLVGE